jgi:hypothetical protein
MPEAPYVERPLWRDRKHLTLGSVAELAYWIVQDDEGFKWFLLNAGVVEWSPALAYDSGAAAFNAVRAARDVYPKSDPRRDAPILDKTGRA